MIAGRLAEDLGRLAALISARLGADPGPTPDLDGAWLAELTGGPKPTPDEYVVVLLALVPHLMPHLFGHLIAEHLPEGGDLPEFGGVKAVNHRGVLPTGETAQFVLAGDDLAQRLAVQRLFTGRYWCRLDPVPDGEPLMSGRLVLDQELVELITTGTVGPPRFSSEFPAERIETGMDWADLVLPPDTMRQIREIENWVAHGGTLLREWGMGRRLKPGFRALFQGPPGTGKTLTATLLGKQTGRDVFRIDLSRVVSKYIGETEKNLSRLFDKAQDKDWILFFDEADALFGKRTDIRDAHDKYANQEVSYLLQRIETYAGLVILATNQRGNIDEAFLRRFQCSVPFPMPGPEQRRQLWTRAIPAPLTVADDVDWADLAHRFELSGASIVNVVQHCAIQALADGSHQVGRAKLEAAVLREFVKEGKVV